MRGADGRYHTVFLTSAPPLFYTSIGVHHTEARRDVVQGDGPGQERAELRGPDALLRAVRGLHGRNHELANSVTGRVPKFAHVIFVHTLMLVHLRVLKKVEQFQTLEGIQQCVFHAMRVPQYIRSGGFSPTANVELQDVFQGTWCVVCVVDPVKFFFVPIKRVDIPWKFIGERAAGLLPHR